MNTTPQNIRIYWPLVLVFIFITAGTLYLGWRQGDSGGWMMDFMGLFFVVFTFFKLLDLPAFARAYKGYDILTKLLPAWGYIYPFVELGFGILLLHRIELFWTNVAIIVVMSISIVGVIQSVLNKREIQCACLGTGFNLPMSQVTIIEDGVMILMALWVVAG